MAEPNVQPVLKQVAAENKLRLQIANDPDVQVLPPQARADLMKRLNTRLASRATAPVTPFASAKDLLSPIEAAKGFGSAAYGMGKGLAGMVKNAQPGETGILGAGGLVAQRLLRPQVEEGRKAVETRGSSESYGHALAAALPGVGPMAADVGEEFGQGRVARGLGKGLAYGLATAAGGKLEGEAELAAGRGGMARGLVEAQRVRAVSNLTKTVEKVAQPAPGRIPQLKTAVEELAPHLTREASRFQARTGQAPTTYQHLSDVLERIAVKNKGNDIGDTAAELKAAVDRQATGQFKQQRQAKQQGPSVSVGGIGSVHHPVPAILGRIRFGKTNRLTEGSIPELFEHAKNSGGYWPSQGHMDMVTVNLNKAPQFGKVKGISKETVRWAIRHDVPVPTKLLDRWPELRQEFALPNGGTVIREVP